MRTTLPVVCLFSVLLSLPLVTLKLHFWFLVCFCLFLIRCQKLAQVRGLTTVVDWGADDVVDCAPRLLPMVHPPPPLVRETGQSQGYSIDTGPGLSSFLRHHPSGGPTPTGQPRPCPSPSPHIPLH